MKERMMKYERNIYISKLLPGRPKVIAKKYKAGGKLLYGNRLKFVIWATRKPRGTTINCRPRRNLLIPSGPGLVLRGRITKLKDENVNRMYIDSVRQNNKYIIKNNNKNENKNKI